MNYVAMTDEELMLRFYLGDDDAFTELVARYDHRLATSAQRRLPHIVSDRKGTGEVLAQEAWLRVIQTRDKPWARWDGARGPCRPWLFSILHRVVSGYLRRKFGVVINSTDLDPAGPEEHARVESLLGADDLSPLAQLTEEESLDALAECIDGLPHAERSVIELLRTGMTQTDIKDVLGVSDATVSRLKRQAYVLLIECLRANNVVAPPITHIQERPLRGCRHD